MKVLLKELVAIQTGVYAKTAPSGNATYLQASMFDAFGKLQVGIVPNVVIEGGLSRHLLSESDVLFVAKGANNFAVEYDAVMGQAIASSIFLILKPMKKSVQQVLPAYLAWYLNHPITQTQLKHQARGSSIPSISKKTLEELEIPLPSLERQQQVLRIQQLRNKEKQIIQRLEVLREQQIQSQLLLAVQQ
ncbi:restriction endonuclease subunit S [Pontibacter sp. JH31]|uniref:Restriction endonuclease subunit S n=1 Tax=Pontibacter aquaedesilientis TaxID=2766980 RepID=A0ABR7XFP2_9BACT|nr:restriction endonuclease subunit S [Pontibacter aquaedesilientis]MBD1396751.1 restriction endonuclease subunit S [Pontibacter aquaedesilientis]